MYTFKTVNSQKRVYVSRRTPNYFLSQTGEKFRNPLRAKGMTGWFIVPAEDDDSDIDGFNGTITDVSPSYTDVTLDKVTVRMDSGCSYAYLYDHTNVNTVGRRCLVVDDEIWSVSPR